MEDSTLHSWKMLVYIAVIWMLSLAAQVDCQECSTTGLNEFGGYRYIFYHGDDGVFRTFAQTREHCQSLGGDVPVITSEEQNEFIAASLAGNGNYWIGLEDIDGDGEYTWIDGTTPGYIADNWNTAGSPDNRCGAITSNSGFSLGSWRRLNCASIRRHICQIPIDVTDGCRWHELGDSQYLIKSGPIATISDARATCQSYGGDLAMIKTAEINAFIKTSLPPSTSNQPYFCYWFGLQRNGWQEFNWLDGSTLGYNDWFGNQHGGSEPNNENSWGCLGVRSGPTWYDHSGTSSFPYICERSRVLEEVNRASFGGQEYFISPSWLDRSYTDARTYCQYHGADLALIKSDGVNTFLHGSGLTPDTCAFFGLTNQATGGTFTWIDGTSLQYSSWLPGEPNNGGNACGCLRSHDDSMTWWDVGCSTQFPFICERYQVIPDYQWSRLGGSEYYISQTSMTSYSFARKFCQAQGGDLAQPKTEEMNAHLIQLAGGNSYWFGLDDLIQANTLQWIDGDLLENNGFPTWSNGDDTFMQNERCVHQQVANGWRKLPCTSYLRFACEKAPNPRSILPVHVMAATSSTYGGGLPDSSLLCLLGSESEQIVEASSLNSNGYFSGEMHSLSSKEVRYTLPSTSEAAGFYECSAVTPSRMTSSHLATLLSTRHFQPSGGRFTKTIHVEDNITIAAMTTPSYVGGENAIRWLKVDEEDVESPSFLGTSSGSLIHTINSATLSDAGVYITFENGMVDTREYSLIRLIVNECPRGQWNPPSCDLLCDICYNGGVCHQHSGTCICPPGFAGENCLQACGVNRFGWECEFECGSGHALEVCSGSQICLPDPYGCNCLAGYTGIYCNETCRDGKFGADCLQECHCADMADCDEFTGECPGDCLQGWSGPACQVPSECRIGYFGANCTQKCNCRNGTACDKDSGFCYEVEGLCDVGYISDSVDFPSNCITFSGCHSSCSKTCHCSDGVEDCNFLTGRCSSSICHPRWMGDQCEIDRFQVNAKKTNPGVAIFSCAFTLPSEDSIPSAYVKAAIGTFSQEQWITYNSSDQTGLILNNSFTHVSSGSEEAIYCYTGFPGNSSEFAFVRLPQREFFVLPSYKSTPKTLNSGYYHVVMGWRQWDPSTDIGDGPVIRYKVYVRLGDRLVVDKEVQPQGMLNKTGPSMMKRSDDSTGGMVMYNVSGLDAGTTYSIQIAAVREGLNGEGEPGPETTIRTVALPTTPSEPPTPFPPSPTTGMGGDKKAMNVAPVAGGAVGAILVILIIVVVVIIVFRKRRNNSPPNVKTIEDPFAPSFEDNNYKGQPSTKPERLSRVPPSTGPKPVVPVKPSVRLPETMEHDSPDGSPTTRHSQKAFVSPQPIPVSEYPDFVHKNRHTALFSQEFRALPEADIYPQIVALKKINFKKNRYKNILPYDSARVKLDIINDDLNSDYFNASYIPSFDDDKAYIASQGPNAASMDDFWRMVWQENVTTIAMVTRLQEADKIKCRQYWPEKQGKAVEFGSITVKLLSLEKCTGGVTRKMVMRKEEDSKTVNQFHFTEWPDKGVPKHTSSLLKFIKEVKVDHGQKKHPLLIHCSAGVGRTGVVISIDSVVSHAKSTGVVDVFNFVTNIRQKRPFMVQTEGQYAFIYGAVLEDLLWRNTSIPVIHFTDHLKDLRTKKDGRGRSEMTREFETLKTLCPDPPASQTRSGRTPDNHPKNRYGNSLPLQRNRVILDSIDDDYINASSIKGSHYAFITTQMPMPNTLSDFWSMVLDCKPSTIVMLNDETQSDKSCAEYWNDNGMAQFGAYSVSSLSVSSAGDMTTRKLKVARNSKDSHTVTHYEFLGWPNHGKKQRQGAQSILNLIHAVNSITNKQDEYSILVHCLSGVGRTGVFCTAMECIAQISEGDTIDIFQTVKMLRADRMHFVQTEEDYALIYDVVREYLRTENYQQVPYPVEDHTYGNVETEHTADLEENPYEVTDIDQATTPFMYGNVGLGVDQVEPKPTASSKPTYSSTVYENFAFES